MELEIVTIGNELLLGYTLDTNSTTLATGLADLGIRVSRRTTVPDTPDAIIDAVGSGLARTGFVITTGGLGPTRDDLTKQAVADLYGVPLVLDREYLEQLRVRFAELGRGPMPESNRTQAEIPRGATPLPNRWGTAPGLWMEDQRGTVVMLPGVPRELRGLLEHEVLPRLAGRVGTDAPVNRSRTLRTTGVSESALADRLAGVETDLAPLTLAFLPDLEGVDLRLTAWGLQPDQAEEALNRGAARLVEILGDDCYGDQDLAEVVLDLLRHRSWTVAVAESCTGGLVGTRLTEVAGASDVFPGGVIAYANRIKEQMLDVPAELLEAHGAVSDETVRAMADGVRSRFGTDAAVAVSGVAGPGGGTEAKPVGTVHLAAVAGDRHRTLGRRFPGGRAEIRRRSAQAALDMLRRLLLD